MNVQLHLDYIFVEWKTDHEEEKEHSIVDGKLADLVNISAGYVVGAEVQCHLREGTFSATILTAGVRGACEVYSIYTHNVI